MYELRGTIGLNTFFFHPGPETLLEAAIATLVTFVFVDDAISTKATSIDVIFADASSKKSFASVATCSSIMFARGPVAANGTKLILYGGHVRDHRRRWDRM